MTDYKFHIVNVVTLLLLSSIWGISFVFQRIAVPEFGVVVATELRVGLAAAVLFTYLKVIRKKLDFKANWKHFLISGFFHTTLPFSMFALAALYIPAGYSAIINSLVPLWVGMFHAIMLKEKVTLRLFASVVLGMLGVLLIVGLEFHKNQITFILGILAGTVATISYGFVYTYIFKHLKKISSPVLTVNTLFAGSLFLMIPSLFFLPETMPSMEAWLAIGGVSIISTAAAYLILYFLMKRMGATASSTTTYLIPGFSMIWAWLIIDEPVTLSMTLGFITCILASYLIISQKRVKPLKKLKTIPTPTR